MLLDIYLGPIIFILYAFYLFTYLLERYERIFLNLFNAYSVMLLPFENSENACNRRTVRYSYEDD